MMRSGRSLRRTSLLFAVSFATVAGCRGDSTAPPGSAGPVDDRATVVAYCAATAPSWVAFQDGDGAWTRWLPEVTGTTVRFRHEFTGNRGAIATLSHPAGGQVTRLDVQYGAPSELTSAGDTLDVDCLGAGTKRLLGSVIALDTTAVAQIRLGPSAFASLTTATGSAYALDSVPAGPLDLVASRTTRLAGIEPRLLIRRRDVDLPDGATIPALDFSSPETFAPATATLTITNLETLTSSFSGFATSTGRFSVPFSVLQLGAAVRPYYALPENKLQPGDVQVLSISTLNGDARSVDVYFRAPIDRTITFGAASVAPTLSTIGSGPAPRIRAHFVPQSDYDRFASIVYGQPSHNAVVGLTMTTTYAERAGSYDLDIPDLSSVSGFDPSWALTPGIGVGWTATLVGGNLPPGRVSPPDGAIRRTSTRQGSFALP